MPGKDRGTWAYGLKRVCSVRKQRKGLARKCVPGKGVRQCLGPGGILPLGRAERLRNRPGKEGITGYQPDGAEDTERERAEPL